MNDDNKPDTPEQSPVALDLDTLAPAAAEISFKGQTIKVRALDLPDYSKLIELYNELGNVEGNENDPTVIMPLYERIRDLINQVVPELKEYTLNLQQLLAVFNLLIEANSPKDKALEELSKRGIEVKSESDGNGDPKVSTSSELSPSSSEATPATE